MNHPRHPNGPSREYTLLTELDENGWNALHYACFHDNHPNLIRTLIKCCENVNTPTKEEDRTPIHIVLRGDIGEYHLGRMNALIEAGADVDYVSKTRDGEVTPLHVAAICGARDMIAALGSERKEIIDKYGDQYVEIAKILVDADADIEKEDDKGDTPIDYANKSGFLAMEDLLREKLKSKTTK